MLLPFFSLRIFFPLPKNPFFSDVANLLPLPPISAPARTGTGEGQEDDDGREGGRIETGGRDRRGSGEKKITASDYYGYNYELFVGPIIPETYYVRKNEKE